MATGRLAVIEQAPASAGACCAACAVAAPAPAPLVGRRPSIGRDLDRRVTAGGLLVAIGFVAAAIVAAVVGAVGGRTVWLPLHLALAGGAGTAVAAVLPFFTAALAVAVPASPRARMVSIALVAVGAAVVSAAVAGGQMLLGAIGGTLYLVGIGGVALVAFRPLRGALGPRRRPVELAYASALAQVATSVAIATAFLAGWMPVVERWSTLKAAHGWLNVVGFVSLVIVATLVHLAPTVEGGRIVRRRSSTIALAGIAVGVPLIAAGYAVDMDVLARLGAAMALVGAVAVPVHALAVARDRGRWTNELAWHRFTSGSLRAASGWFVAAIAVAAGRVIWFGADPAGWSIGLVAVPLAVGWVLQVLIGSWSHLLPAIGPGDQPAHAVQRRTLGRLAGPRLLALNGGVAALWFGGVLEIPVASTLGAACIGAALLSAVALAARAARPTRRY